MDDLPEPQVLASLAIAVRTYMGPAVMDHQAMEEALRWYRLAQAKLKAEREQIGIAAQRDDEFTSLLDGEANQVRLEFTPVNATDEVRAFLEEKLSDDAPKLRNIKKGSTVKQKLEDFFVDAELLVGETIDKGKAKFEKCLGLRNIAASGAETYRVAKSDLCRFRQWLYELPKLEALIRKKRKNGPHFSALEVRVRLVVAGTGNRAKAEKLRSIYGDGKDSEEVSRKIISELRSLDFTKRRTQ